MKIIKVSIPNDFPFIRQLPVNDPFFDGYRFIVNSEIDACDYWVVYDNLKKEETTYCPHQNTILFTGEPSSVKTYNRHFTDQFSLVVTNQKRIHHKNKIQSQTSLPWLVGIKYDKDLRRFVNSDYLSFEDFNSFDTPVKSKLISVITSNKNLSKGHKERLAFVFALKEALGDQIELFGSGFNDIPDKSDALNSFKYTLVIENSFHQDYWTEKLADAFLCNCYPIFYGCPNIHEYFSSESLTTIDIKNKKKAIADIIDVIKGNYFESHLASILEAKRKVLTQYNLFYQIKMMISSPQFIGETDKVKLTLFPEKATLFDKMQTRIQRLI